MPVVPQFVHPIGPVQSQGWQMRQQALRDQMIRRMESGGIGVGDEFKSRFPEGTFGADRPGRTPGPEFLRSRGIPSGSGSDTSVGSPSITNADGSTTFSPQGPPATARQGANAARPGTGFFRPVINNPPPSRRRSQSSLAEFLQQGQRGI